jgi:hypothetical protein
MPVALAVWLVAAGVAGGPPAAAASGGLTLASPAFEAGSGIPRRHTCEGEDVSPPLRWSHVPEDARSLVLVVDDPDAPDPAAPRRTWVHWLLYDLPPDATGLPEDVARADLPPGTKQGRNDWKRTGYGGPCPPIGRHRYFFKLYALDRKLGDLEEPTGAELERAMQGRILQRAELVGTYQKQR